MGSTLSGKEETVSQQGPTVAEYWGNNFPSTTVFPFTQKKKELRMLRGLENMTYEGKAEGTEFV